MFSTAKSVNFEGKNKFSLLLGNPFAERNQGYIISNLKQFSSFNMP
jgi:hypothetical protein